MLDPIGIATLLFSISQYINQLKTEAKKYSDSPPDSKVRALKKDRDDLKSIIKTIRNLNKDLRPLKFLLHQAKDFHETFQELFEIIDKVDLLDSQKLERSRMALKELVKEVDKTFEDDLKSLRNYFERIQIDQHIVDGLPFISEIKKKIEKVRTTTPRSTEIIDELLVNIGDLRTFVKDNNFSSNSAKELVTTIDDNIKQGLSYADRMIHSLIPIIETCDLNAYNSLNGLELR